MDNDESSNRISIYPLAYTWWMVYRVLTSDGISSNKMEPVLRIRKRKDVFSGLVIVHAEMLIFAANIEEKIAEL